MIATRREREAMERSWAKVMPPGPEGKEIWEDGWEAAKRFYVGRGYTPRSMLRAQAFTKGYCPICGSDLPTEGQDDGPAAD